MFPQSGFSGSGPNTLDGHKLLQDSLCIDYGMNIPDNGGRDFWDNVIQYNDITNRGAHSYFNYKLKENKKLRLFFNFKRHNGKN